MYHIVRKLKNEDGASLSIALLFFVVCAVVGSVILSAGTAASGRVARLKLEEADANSLKRCAYYMCSELSDQQLVILTEDDGTVTYLDSEGEPLGSLISGNGRSYIGRLVYNTTAAGSPVTIVLNDNTEDIFKTNENGIKVRCSGVMDQDYNITLVFTPYSSESFAIDAKADKDSLPSGTVTARIPALVGISDGKVTRVCWTTGKVSMTN